jgi:phage gp36-like protein
MAYNTKADLLAELSEATLMQLTDDDNIGVVDDNVLARVFAKSAAMVDGYCSNLYDVPFAVTPPFIQALDLDIAIYLLFARRENIPESRAKQHTNAIKLLEGIGSGKIQVGVSGKNAPAQSGQTIQVSTPSIEIFTPTRLRNY